ncbi:MAG: porin [Lysobacterales bacterium]|jgi:porin
MEFSMNSVGIVITVNGLESNLDFKRTGIPLSVIRRKALQTQTLHDALVAIYKSPRAVSNNMFMSTIRVLCCLLVLCMPCASALASAYEFDATYTGDIWSNTSGGIRTGTRYLDNLDLTLEVDVDEAWNFGSGTFFVYGMYNNNSTFSEELVGDLQVISNIEASRAWRIYEFWYQYGKGPWSFRLGLYDLNSEFDVAETRGLFLNSSNGIGPDMSQTGLNGPSIFPITSLSLRSEFKSDQFTARMAVLDGVPGDPDDPASNVIRLGNDDGVLIVGELDYAVGEDSRVWAGYWRYSAEFEHAFDQGLSNDNDGWYFGIEKAFQLRTKSAGWFLRFGRVNDDLNPIGNFIGAGATIDGLFSTRPHDQFGFAIASAGAGSPYKNFLNQAGLVAKNRETTWELTYRAEINPHLVLQPDIQYVQYPSASSEYRNAFAVGLRFELSY